MFQKTVEVTPYTHTYRAFNKHTGATHGNFDSIADAVNFAKNQPRRHRRQDALSYTRKLEADKLYERDTYVYDYHCPTKRWYETRRRVVLESYHYPAGDWVIVNDLGEVAEKADVEAALRKTYRNYGWGSWDAWYMMHGARLTRIKGSGDKVKESCARVLEDRGYGDSYTNINRRGYHRIIGTTNEKRQTAGHMDEYGQSIVRGRRRPRLLPDNWDDRGISLSRSETSWKHHSKRRKQWKPK